MEPISLPGEFAEEAYYAGPGNLVKVRQILQSLGTDEERAKAQIVDLGWSETFAEWCVRTFQTGEPIPEFIQANPHQSYNDYLVKVKDNDAKNADNHSGWMFGFAGFACVFLRAVLWGSPPSAIFFILALILFFVGALRVLNARGLHSGYALLSFTGIFWIWIALQPLKLEGPPEKPRDPASLLPLDNEGRAIVPGLEFGVPFNLLAEARRHSQGEWTNLVEDGTAALRAGKSPEAFGRAMVKADWPSRLSEWFPFALRDHISNAVPPIIVSPSRVVR